MRKPAILIASALGVVLLLVLGLAQLRTGGGSGGRSTEGEGLVVYCAAGLKPAVEPLLQDFEARYRVSIQVQYGGSGTLLSNLQVSRSGDLYVSGDASYQEIAREKGLVEEILPLARMRPVIGVRKGNPKSVEGVKDLIREDVRVAMANPGAASIGKQTRALLEEAGLWAATESRVRSAGVFKPTVNEVANDVKLGAVDASVIWDSTANQYPEIEAVRDSLLDAAEQEVQIGVLSSSKQPLAALRLARFLNSEEGNAVFSREGFEAVDGDVWEWSPEITFYCGAVNRRAVEDVIKAFEDREGVTVNTVYNGCGILTAQMRTINQGNGAGFPDVYMACDRYYLETVQEWFQEDSDISDARIVVAVPKGNPKQIQSLQDLTKPGMRISVGQPEQCTIGALTRILLEKEGILDEVMANVVTQAASSAQLVPSIVTKSVDAAIAYETDTRAEQDKIHAVEIDSPYAVAVQPFSIARKSDYKYLGRRLFAEIRQAKDAFEEAGFQFRGQEEEQEETSPL